VSEGFSSQGLGYLENPMRSVFEEFKKAHPAEHFEVEAFRFPEHHNELRLEITDPDGQIHRHAIQFSPGIDMADEVRKLLGIIRENWVGQSPAESA
jgi:hypothetical protein